MNAAPKRSARPIAPCLSVEKSPSRANLRSAQSEGAGVDTYPSQPVSIAMAAKRIGKSPGAIRRWLREGAPCEQPGEAGRGNGALVSVPALLQWKSKLPAPGADDLLATLARVALDYHRRNTYGDAPAHVVTGISAQRAAKYLVGLFEYAATRIVGREIEEHELPSEIRALVETARK